MMLVKGAPPSLPLIVGFFFLGQNNRKKFTRRVVKYDAKYGIKRALVALINQCTLQKEKEVMMPPLLKYYLLVFKI